MTALQIHRAIPVSISLIAGYFAYTALVCAATESSLPSTPHKLQVSNPIIASQVAKAGGRLIANYGSFSVYETALPLAQLKSIAASGIEIRDDFNRIELNAGVLDTSKSEIQTLRKSVGPFIGKRLHLIQFAGPVLPLWHDQLTACGVQIVTYIPENAYLVYGDTSAIADLQTFAATASHVQWDAPYLDFYKLDPAARTTDALGNPRTIGTTNFAIQLLLDSEANPASLAVIDHLKTVPILRQEIFQNYLNVVVPIAPEKVPLVAAQPEVISIQPYFVPKKFCERQAQIVAGNLVGDVPSG